MKKWLGRVLPAVGAVVALGVGYLAAFHTMPPPPAPKIVEVVKTVPDAGSTAQKLAAIEAEIRALRGELAELAARRKAVAKAAPKKK